MPSPEGYENIEIRKSEEVAKILEERHILDDEVRMIIHNAEGTGEKLYQEGTDRYLAKLMIGNVTFYAEYSPAGEQAYVVHTAYSHRAKLVEE